jgi:hypothetical protein
MGTAEAWVERFMTPGTAPGMPRSVRVTDHADGHTLIVAERDSEAG